MFWLGAVTPRIGAGALAFAVVLAGTTGCMLGVGCEDAVLEAQPATIEQGPDGKRIVRFVAQLTDGDGGPIEGGFVSMTVAPGPPVTSSETGADGVAVGEATFREVKDNALGADILEEWAAHFSPHDPVGGVVYCYAEDHAAVPEELIRLET